MRHANLFTLFQGRYFQSLRCVLITAVCVGPGTAFAQTPVAPLPTSNVPLETQLKARVLKHHPEAQIEVQVLDQRPLERTCEAPVHKITGQQIVGRIPIRVRCHGQAPWSFYIYAQVEAKRPLVTAAHPIARGAVISDQDLTLTLQPIRKQGQPFTQPASLVGLLAARTIVTGQVIQIRHVKRAMAVKRGDQVTIQARHGMAVISAQGTALKSGYIGDQIPVKNSSSQRVIHTWIVAKGVVDTRATQT